MKLSECNPFVRTAQIQPAILEGTQPRMAYDHRLFYVLENEGLVFIDDDSTAISADTLIIIPPMTGYYFKGKLRVAVLNFDMTRAFTHRPSPICPPPVSMFDKKLCFDMTLAESFEKPMIFAGDIILRDAVLQIVRSFSEGDSLSDAQSSAELKALLVSILRSTVQSDDRLISRVYGYIRSNASAIHDNTQLAEEFGYHPVYLGELFKSVTGITLHDAISDERIKLACRWLTQTDRGIEEIALSTGFCSRSHFCTAFKARVGSTPSEYRKNRS